jgi:hypothetical protein
MSVRLGIYQFPIYDLQAHRKTAESETDLAALVIFFLRSFASLCALRFSVDEVYWSARP